MKVAAATVVKNPEGDSSDYEANILWILQSVQNESLMYLAARAVNQF